MGPCGLERGADGADATSRSRLSVSAFARFSN